MSVLALAACGSGTHVDKGGFTAEQRKDAQAALNLLHRTSIPQRVVAISYQAGQAPSTCSVMPRPGSDRQFQLLLAWDPTNPAYATQAKSVLEATIGSLSAAADRFQVVSYGGHGGKPEPAALQASVERALLATTGERCEALQDGSLQLVPD